MPNCAGNPTREDYADFIYRHGNSSLTQLENYVENGCFSYVNQEFAVFHVPLSGIAPISLENYPYSAIPKLYALLDNTSVEAAGILPSFRLPSLNTRGEGVIIGFIDTGIDYRNPLFMDNDGNTRVLGIWDQTLPGEGFTVTGPNEFPFRFLYGREFLRPAIDEALRSEDPLSVVPSADEEGHGTFLAGAAGGSEVADMDFIGAAPSCWLGMVKLKPAKQYLRDFYHIPQDAAAYQSNDIMLGVTWLTTLAYRYNMPLVICLSLGSNQGGHDGSSPLAQVLNRLQIFLGVSAVCAAGNETGRQHHYVGQVSRNTVYDEAELRVAENEPGFDVELWASPPEVYTIGLVSPTGESIDRIPLRDGHVETVRFPIDQTTVTVAYETISGGQRSYLALLHFTAPSPGIWRIRVYPTVAITGTFHMWLPVHGFVKDDTVFLRSDPFTTITSPGNSPFAITAGAYNHLNGSLYIHSSRGYTRDGMVKPDLAAPGVSVYGPGRSPADGVYPMIRMTGTSASAALAAGAVADLYSWGYVRGNDPYITNNVVKAYLTRGAKRNPSYAYPSREWGYGTLDLYQSLLSLRN